MVSLNEFQEVDSAEFCRNSVHMLAGQMPHREVPAVARRKRCLVRLFPRPFYESHFVRRIIFQDFDAGRSADSFKLCYVRMNTCRPAVKLRPIYRLCRFFDHLTSDFIVQYFKSFFALAFTAFQHRYELNGSVRSLFQAVDTQAGLTDR